MFLPLKHFQCLQNHFMHFYKFRMIYFYAQCLAELFQITTCEHYY
jgi:hypothetical protein